MLILAPHPDDEVVACGIAATRARRDGALVSVIYLTTGVPPREQLWRWQRAGYRSRVAHRRDEAARAAALLQLEQRGCSDVYNLTGGIDAWARQIDPAMQIY